ncbi:acylphosphatase [Staphylococcus coagulans]|uniref:acylphosphatase n=1 Tax=Staphylococcus coagulans TaxID=74706 RepID=UPI0033652D09
MKHYLIRVYGRVQGVGFRYFTERLAMQYEIVGNVKNKDAYVEVHAQGNETQLESFTKAVSKGASPASRVTHYSVDELEIEKDFRDFKVIS